MTAVGIGTAKAVHGQHGPFYASIFEPTAV